MAVPPPTTPGMASSLTPLALQVQQAALHLCISLHPLLGDLFKLLCIRLVLLRNGHLDSVVGVGLDEQAPHHVEHGSDAIGRLPLVGAQHADAHAALVIVADIGVIDAGREGDLRRLEGVFVGETYEELEGGVLGWWALALACARPVRVRLWSRRGAKWTAQRVPRHTL